MSVLLVEDDPALRRLLQTLVLREKLGAEIVARGDDALKAIESGRHLAIVLDLMLPVMNGFEILRRLRASNPDLLSRIIVLTAVSQSQLENVEVLSSIWRIVRKPFEVPELVQTLRECVATHAAKSLPERDRLTQWLAAQAAVSGAKAALIAAISGRELELRATYGFEEGAVERLFPVPLNANYPVCVAARTGRPVWLASLTLASPEYPLLLPIWTMAQSHALAAVPLLRNGVAIGAIGWSFAEPQPFAEPQRAALLEIASECAAMIPPLRSAASL